MATGSGTDPRVATPSSDPFTGIATLLRTFGGERTTSNPGNTSALTGATDQLKGQDFEAMLQSIFQKAGGQIPGLSASFGRAVGARSGSNSAVQAALAKLLQDTTLSGQAQIAQQQLVNTGQQINAGSAIAQATRGTTQQQGTNLSEAGQNLALLRLVSEGFDRFGPKTPKPAGATPATGVAPAAPMTGPVTNSAMPAAPTTPLTTPYAPPSYTPGALPDFSSGAPAESYIPAYTPTSTATPGYSPYEDPGAYDEGIDYIPQPDEGANYGYEFADGGEIRDRKKTETLFERRAAALLAAEAAANRGGDANAAFQARLEAELKKALVGDEDEKPDKPDKPFQFANGGMVGRDGEAFDKGHMRNRVMDSFARFLATEMVSGAPAKKPEGYADGGSVAVRAGGSRRSLNPMVDLTVPDPLTVNNIQPGGGGNPAAALNGIAPLVNSALPHGPSDLAIASATAGLAGRATRAIGGSDYAGEAAGLNNAALAFSFADNPEAAARSLAVRRGTEAALSSTMGESAVPYAGATIGAYRALTADTEEQRFAGAARTAMNFIPVVGTGLGIVDDLTGGNIASSAGNALSNDFYFTRDAVSNPLGAIGSYVNNQNNHFVRDADFLSDTAAHWGGSIESGVRDFGDSLARFSPFADGGKLKGPGTGISDDITIKASKGEYMLSADTVEAVGVDFLDALQQAFHTPAAIQRAQRS